MPPKLKELYQPTVLYEALCWYQHIILVYNAEGEKWRVGCGEGPGEEGLRWYPVLPPAAAKQDTTSSFIRGMSHPRVVSLITILIS